MTVVFAAGGQMAATKGEEEQWEEWEAPLKPPVSDGPREHRFPAPARDAESCRRHAANTARVSDAHVPVLRNDA